MEKRRGSDPTPHYPRRTKREAYRQTGFHDGTPTRSHRFLISSLTNARGSLSEPRVNLDNIMEDFENSVIGCFCTLLESRHDNDSGEIIDDSENQYVVLLASGQQITLNHDDVIICD